ncbi:hypothetical protein [Amycolatopsis suaedae]|uniref:Uncharacterized protein n=1 Tax=Amycolatopsis suaedae TaxID=2510978 RepID=A0A4Q7J0E9_9PSEU|nr:hypothetical protein [Amycolatopsis suaedae]RZQ59846.1 hypothetical protein EWH70_32555 [Amycolatopsis suaedae]
MSSYYPPPPPPPRSVIDWYSDGIAVLERARERALARRVPIAGGDLFRAMELAQELVRIEDPHAH